MPPPPNPRAFVCGVGTSAFVCQLTRIPRPLGDGTVATTVPESEVLPTIASARGLGRRRPDREMHAFGEEQMPTPGWAGALLLVDAVLLHRGMGDARAAR
jgi:hypothetical protein